MSRGRAGRPARRRCRGGSPRESSAVGRAAGRDAARPPVRRPTAPQPTTRVRQRFPAGRGRGSRRSRRPRPVPRRPADQASTSRDPAPTSSTTSSASTVEVRTMRRTVLASTTKFWPSFFVGRMPRRAASARTSAARAGAARRRRRSPVRCTGSARTTATPSHRCADRGSARGRSARSTTRRSGHRLPPTPAHELIVNW